MFKGCYNFGSLDLSNFNTQNVTDMSSMFEGCANGDWNWDSYPFGLSSINLSSFNTSNVTNMSKMFKGCFCLSSLNLSNFNTQNVTDMSYMFYETTLIWFPEEFGGVFGIHSLNLSSFNTSSVSNMSYMFGKCYRISSLNLSNFNMSNVTSKTGMCSGLSTCSGTYDWESGWTNCSCTITCPLSVQTAMQSGTSLPTSGVTFTWVRP